MSERQEFELALWRAVESFLGDALPPPPVQPPPGLPSAGRRPPGLLMGFRTGDTEVGLLFYRGAKRNSIWLQHGSGKGKFTDMTDPAQATSFPLTIVMSCGTTVTWDNEQRVPPNAMDCGCGSANHRLVVYLEATPPALAKPAAKPRRQTRRPRRKE